MKKKGNTDNEEWLEILKKNKEEPKVNLCNKQSWKVLCMNNQYKTRAKRYIWCPK